MKIDATQNSTFKSTKIPVTGNKKSFMSYIDVLPPKVFKSYSGKSVEECLTDLKTTDNSLGLLLGKDKCFYVFGKTKNQDEFLYHRLKKLDSRVEYKKDVTD